MELCFDRELLEVLTPAEIIYISLAIIEDRGGDPINIDITNFYETTAYEKLFEYYADEMPYNVAKYRTGEADIWILDKLRERADGLYP
tara:strand:- start:2124 stop:2387 length:264 start_codon:yes stop_codon:yes gene_type:complete